MYCYAVYGCTATKGTGPSGEYIRTQPFLETSKSIFASKKSILVSWNVFSTILARVCMGSPRARPTSASTVRSKYTKKIYCRPTLVQIAYVQKSSSTELLVCKNPLLHALFLHTSECTAPLCRLVRGFILEPAFHHFLSLPR